MQKIIVTGTGPEIGKTLVSAILTVMFRGNYWKPIECGGSEEGTDSQVIAKLIDTNNHTIYPSSYSFQAPVSPHHASRLENKVIDPNRILLPASPKTLTIETPGGLFTPLSTRLTCLDVFQPWQGKWIVVSKHYLGSINHTLLTVEALKSRSIPVLGIIFNGTNPDSEEAIMQITQLPMLGRLLPEPSINKETIQKYIKLWQTQFTPIL